MKPSICICGGGNLGLVCAGVFAANGYSTNILTGHPERWCEQVTVTDPDGKIFRGSLAKVSADASEVIPSADIVLLCLPGNVIEQTLRQIAPWLKDEAVVGSIVSSTGFFFCAHKILPGRTVFGFQRVPFIARVAKYGCEANLLGYKPHVDIAIENSADPDALLQTLEELFMTPARRLESFYEAALTNSNPILHTGRMFTLWGQAPVKPVAEPPLFYADWTDEASQMLIAMDREFMSLLKALGVRDGAIPPLLEYYESTDAPSLTRKIRSIEAFKKIKSPMLQTDAGWVPDYSSRYFVEDFGYGLRFIKELADKHGVDAPNISRVYAWGSGVMKP